MATCILEDARGQLSRPAEDVSCETRPNLLCTTFVRLGTLGGLLNSELSLTLIRLRKGDVRIS
jgi:hypothetical protein